MAPESPAWNRGFALKPPSTTKKTPEEKGCRRSQTTIRDNPL
jgi:hypothetical protein